MVRAQPPSLETQPAVHRHPMREMFTDEEWAALSRQVQMGEISWPIGIVLETEEPQT